jgi:hypothetical protein
MMIQRSGINLVLAVAFAAFGVVVAFAADTNKAKQPAPDPKTAPVQRQADDATELTKLLGVTAPIDEAFNQLWAEAVKETPAPPGKSLEGFRALVAPQRKELQRTVESIYEQALTGDEIRKAVEFLRTPVGQKLMRGLGDEQIPQLTERFFNGLTESLTQYLGRAATKP